MLIPIGNDNFNIFKRVFPEAARDSVNPAAAPSSVSSALSPGDAGGCSSRYLTGSVDGGVGSIVRWHLEYAGVRLHALSKDRLVILEG